MRKLSLKEYIGILIFFLTIALASLIAFPVYGKVTKSLNALSKNIFETVTQKTGLVISYKKLSPSVFAGLNVKLITVKSEDGQELCEIKKINVRYNLFALITGQGLKSINNVILDGFSLDVNNSNYVRLMQKLGVVTVQESDSKTNKVEVKGDNKSFTLGKITTEIPFDVFFKNVSLTYKTPTQTFSGHLKKLTLAFQKNRRTLVLDTTGSLVTYKNQDTSKRYSTNFSAQGNLPEKLNGSSLVFRLSDITDGTLSVGKLNLLFGYNNDTFDIRTIQNGYPLFLHGSYDTKSYNGLLEINTKHLRPLSILTSKKGNKTIKKIKNLTIDINGSAKFNTETKKINYNSNGKVYVPDSIFHGGFDTVYSVKGTEKSLDINKFALSGPNIDVNVNLAYIFNGMRLSGTANVNQVVLPNGGVISSEIFFDPRSKGFMAFAPQFLMDDKALTGIQFNLTPVKDSVDFSFELSDYYHAEQNQIGKLSIDGSYIGGTNYVQANIETNGMYLDSLAQTGMFFVRKKDDKPFNFNFLSSYLLNGEIFFSTDMKSISFNVPYLFAANTKKDDQVLYLSMVGNTDSIQISRLDYIANGKRTHLEAQYEKSPDSNDAFFFADLTADSIPYHFTGNIMSDSINVSGDYGLAFDMFKTGFSRYDGTFSMAGFPLPVAGMIMTLSTDSGFTINPEEGLNLKISKLEANEVSGKFIFDPHFYLSGEINKYGLSFGTVSYSDTYSTLLGSAQGSWNIDEGGFNSLNTKFTVKNDVSKEEIDLDAELLSTEDNELFVNAKLLFNVFCLNRFTAETSDNNTLTASVVASGAITNPFIGINIDRFSLMQAGNAITATGNAYVEEKNLSLEKININYGDFNLKDLNAKFDLNNFTGNMDTLFSGNVMDKTINAPLNFSVSDTYIEEGQFLPSEFVANLSCPKLDGTLFTKKFPVNLSLVHSKDTTLVYTGPEQGIQGSISKEGNIHFTIDDNKPLDFELKGSIVGNSIDLSLQGINANVAEIFSYIDNPMLKIYGGQMKGSVKITGLKADPEFMGALSLTGADFTLPTIVPSHITVPKAILTLNHNKIMMPEVQGLIRKQTPIYADLDVTMDRWNLDQIKSHIWIPKNVYGPGDFDIRIARFTGEANIDLNLLFEDGILDCTGDVNVRNVDAQIVTKELVRPQIDDFPVRCSVKLGFGPHVSFRFDPLIRAVFVPDSEFTFSMDTTDQTYKIDGEIALRSGDISYLNRSFYLKKGTMKFNANDPTFNPLISVQAETRERDDDGNDIRIILTANNQYLLNFNPQFSSIPARSETEIRSMLGQIALGDSDNISSLILSAGDYAVQSLIGRNIENKLREFLNFDILSIRTNVLQNALKQGLSNNVLSFSETNSIGIGNLLDNSTVYIGKYFGSDLYVDALMHWSYDDTRVDDTLTIGGLVFKPEIGFELVSPFVNIRWSMAPDIDAMMNNRIVSSTSVTLSWNFSF